MFSVTGFAAPWWFLLLLGVAALVAGYVLVQRRRKRHTVKFTNLALLETVAPKRPGRWRHIPAVLLILALLTLTVSLAGPTAEQRVPRNRATVLLVVDVSLSMQATDVQPNRLRAAQVAAKSFSDNLTQGINLGLISFAGSAVTLVSPTTDRAAVNAGIDGLQLSESTATGEAIFSGMQTVQNFSEIVSGGNGPPPARIVLLSDGKQTVPTRDPADPRGAFTAAEAAKKQGIPVSTISFGTTGATVDIDGTPIDVSVDDDSLRRIAEISEGEFFKAASAEQLKQVYDTLGEQIGYELKNADASKPWVVLGTLLAIAGAGSALFIGQRLP